MKLFDIADVIRSKNSGPYELTFDIIFKDFETFNKVAEANIINKSKCLQNFILLKKMTYWILLISNLPKL